MTHAVLALQNEPLTVRMVLLLEHSETCHHWVLLKFILLLYVSFSSKASAKLNWFSKALHVFWSMQIKYVSQYCWKWNLQGLFFWGQGQETSRARLLAWHTWSLGEQFPGSRLTAVGTGSKRAVPRLSALLTRSLAVHVGQDASLGKHFYN